MLRRFFRWFFDLDSPRKHSVLKASVSGKPLVIFDMGSGSRGWSIRNTPEGIRGGVLISCFEIHFTMKTAREIANGIHDDILTKECKDRAVRKIVKVLEQGYYTRYEHVDPYDPGFELIQIKLTDSEKKELTSLLAIKTK